MDSLRKDGSLSRSMLWCFLGMTLGFTWFLSKHFQKILAIDRVRGVGVNYKIVFLGLSLFLYGVALSLPCLLFNVVPIDAAGGGLSDPNNVYAMKGIELTFFGMIGLLFLQIPALGWLGNPIYWFCCVTFMMQRYRFSATASLAAILIGFGGTFSAF